MKFSCQNRYFSLTKQTLLIICLVVGLISISYSANRTWSGATDGNWNEPTNWVGGVVPTSADNAIFNGTYTNPCVLNVVATYTVVNVTFQSTFNTAFTIAAGGSLTFTGIFSIDGTSGGVFNMTGGTLTGKTPGVVSTNFNSTMGAVTNFTGGTMTFARAFAVNTGSRFNMPSGTPTINITGTPASGALFSVRDKNGGTSSLFDMDAGTVSCATIAEVNGMSTGSSPEINISGGTFTTTGGTSFLQWDGGTSFGDRPVVNISGGTVNIGSSTLSNNWGDAPMTFNISGGDVTLKDGLYMRNGDGSVMNSDVLTITGASTTVTFTGFGLIRNWGLIDGSGATGTSKVVFATNITFDDGSGGVGVFKFPGVTINSGKTLDQTGVPAIEVYGDWTNDGGTYTHGNGLVTFRGGIARNITGTTGTTFYDLTINNTSATGVTLLKPVTVTNALTLTDGILFTDAINLLTLNDGATSSSGSAASFVDGPMKKTGDDAFVFPLGDGTVWARLGISDPGADITQEYTAQYYASAFGDLSVSGTLSSVSTVEYWELAQGGSTDNVQVTLYWEDAVRSGITNNNSCDLTVAHYDASGDWENVGQASISGTTPGSITSPVATDYNPIQFTFGFTTPVMSVSSNSSICNGSSRVLTASGANSYTWSPSTGLDVTTGSSVTATPGVGTITYTVTGTAVSGCTSIATVIITVNSLPTITASSSTSICIGSWSNLTASGGSTYTWSPSTGLDVTTGTSVIATPGVGTTTYTVNGTSTNGCTSNSTVSVTVNSLPTITASSSTSICIGFSSPLTASGASTYTWSPATGLDVTTGSSVVATPGIGTTTYTVTGTNATGCTSTATVSVTVNSLPTITALMNSTICSGSNSTLTAGGASTYTWSPATGLDVTMGSTVIATPGIGTTTYTVTGTNAKGCTSNATVSVTVNSLPTITASTNSTICSGSNSTLTASGASTYTWSPATGLDVTMGSTVIATPGIGITTYTVTGTNAKGCTESAAVAVTVNALPTANAGFDVVICSGDPASLSASGGVVYQWSPAAYLNATTGANITATPTLSGTYGYTVTVTDANNCTSTDDVIVTVAASLTAYAGLDVSICSGATTTLTGSGGSTYSWNPSTGLNSSTLTSPTFTISIPGSYDYTLTASSGSCNSTDIVTITVNSLPTITVSSNSTICSGSFSALIASGGSIYTWSPSTGLDATTGSSVNASPGVGTTTYTVTGTSASGCTGNAAVAVMVNSLPTITASSNSTICSGFFSSITASGGNTYTWSPATGLNVTTGSSVVATPGIGATTYTVTGTNASGCMSSTTVSVTVNSSPTLTASVSSTICSGTTTSLTANGAGSYSWSAGTVPSTGPTVNVNPTVNSTYTVTGTTSNCTSTKEITVFVSALPVINILADNTTLCQGDTANLTASGATSYNWSAGTTPSTGPTVSVSPASTTTYSVTGTDANNCSSDTSITITSATSLPVSVGNDITICSGSTTTLTASGAPSYNWSSGTIPSTGAIVEVSPTITSSYTVSGSTGNCTSTDEVTVFVNNLPVINIIADNTTICQGNTANLTASGAGTYSWSVGTTPSTGPIVSVSPNSSTTYNVIGTDANNCSSSTNITISVYSLPNVDAGINITIGAGNTATLMGTGASYYLWSPTNSIDCNTCQTIKATPLTTTTYSLIGTSAEGCPQSDVVTVYVKAICKDPYIPNAFSPNNDGQNDVLYVEDRNCKEYKDFYFAIYNRWGVRVFESFDIEQGWDGKFKDIDLPGGVYVYELRAGSISKKGNITIVR